MPNSFRNLFRFRFAQDENIATKPPTKMVNVAIFAGKRGDERASKIGDMRMTVEQWEDFAAAIKFSEVFHIVEEK
jgi:hypothetical protein